MTRLGILVSHPIQYYTPLFRELATRMDIHVFYGQLADHDDQAAAGFGVGFQWDVELMSGYPYTVLNNSSRKPDVSTFNGCDAPNIRVDLAAKDINTLLVFGWYQKVFLQGVWAAKQLGIPVLVRGDSQLGMPGNALKRLAKNIFYPTLLRNFDAALYVGNASREYYEHYGYSEERLFFSPHCIDTSRFEQNATVHAREQRRAALGVSDDTRLILFSGKLIDIKQPLDLVRAASNLLKRGTAVELLIAGSGPLEPAMMQEADRLHVPIHFLGFCNQSAMPVIYAMADVLVLCSASETWGLVCNEALASGTPIVVADTVGCAPDLAADGYVGRTFAKGNIDALANTLAATLASPPTKEAIRAVSDTYSVANAADGIEAALRYSRHRASGGLRAVGGSHD